MSITEDRSGELQVYEIGYLVLPSIPEDKLPEVVANLENIVTKGGAQKLDSEMPFKRDLAYAISKVVGASKYVVRDAYIGWMKFEAEPSQVEGIKAEVEKAAEILRFLLIKAPRESAFTFAKAREAQRAEEAPEEVEIDPDKPANEVVEEVEAEAVVE